jgi:CheY-like chemotaxis protein
MRTCVLVVDDDPQVRGLVEAVLSEDADVTTVPDGPTALQVLAHQRFDCVLLDVMMPGMSGISVLETVRADPILRRTPVVMLTALTSEAHHAEAYRDGADAYLTKPFDVDALLQTVREVVEMPAEERAERRRAELERAELLARIESSFGR